MKGDVTPHIAAPSRPAGAPVYGAQTSARTAALAAAHSVPALDRTGWLEAFAHIARHYGLPSSSGAMLAASLERGTAAPEMAIARCAQSLGLGVRIMPPDGKQLSRLRLPLVLELEDGAIGVLVAVDEADIAAMIFSGDDGQSTPVPAEPLIAAARLMVVARPAGGRRDARVDAYIRPYEAGWFRRLVLRDLRPYLHVALASLIANSLALAGVVFSMQVYDRVVPAQSYDTLYVLFLGVMLAIGFDFAMRWLRTRIVDLVGRRTDLKLSDLVFGHALRVRNAARPASTGSFIAQLRDLEQVRELLTSTTISALADLPFFFLFLALFWIIGGPLFLVPLSALLLLLLPGALIQQRLKSAANEAVRESSLRNALLVEAVQGVEDIKMLQAEPQIMERWNHFNAVAADAQMRVRAITATLTTWSHSVQTSVFAVIVCIGAPLVIAGDMTTGALVACSILGSRMMAPMAQLTQVLSRLQHARIGMNSLDAIMQMPVDHPPHETRISAPALNGAYRLRAAKFHHSEAEGRPALSVSDLAIRPGEKIALLGRNGAGKSTLLQALAGMIEPSAGEITLDDLALGQIDPADIRRHTGLITQEARLFHGTIRENVTMGAPNASAPQILEALALAGADIFIRRLPKGMDHPILEGGRGLSGGQKQALLLARILVRQPRTILLDEPTAAMDEASERQFIQKLAAWNPGHTLIIATHRMRALDLVERIVVLDHGEVVLDAPKDKALKTLNGVGKVVPAKRMAQARPS